MFTGENIRATFSTPTELVVIQTPRVHSPFSIRLLRLIGLALLIAAVSACSVSGGESPSSSGEVVFSADVDGNIDIYKTDNETDSLVRITSAEGDDYLPAWSPNNRSIAFLSDRNGTPAVWVYNVEGETKRQLSGSEISIASYRWAPGSKRIAVEVVN
ncbi:MAG: hypothetical protein V3T49_04350 [Dehalococcoidia bacterium]